MDLSDLAVGSLVKDPNTKYNGDVIVWQILEHGHSGTPTNSTTLQSRDILTLKAFDAAEPNNTYSDRQQYGNNYYPSSNIAQWLVKDDIDWYSPSHVKDESPSSSYVTCNPYVLEAGFLSNFSDSLKNLLMTGYVQTLQCKSDGGRRSSFSTRVFLLSRAEVGLGDEYSSSSSLVEGSVYSLYNENADYRIKNLINDAAKGEYTEATSPWLWSLRTASYTSRYGIRVVAQNGTLGSTSAYSGGYNIGIAPAIWIPQDTKVSNVPDANNIYSLILPPFCKKVYAGVNNKSVLIWEP